MAAWSRGRRAGAALALLGAGCLLCVRTVAAADVGPARGAPSARPTDGDPLARLASRAGELGVEVDLVLPGEPFPRRGGRDAPSGRALAPADVPRAAGALERELAGATRSTLAALGVQRIVVCADLTGLGSPVASTTSGAWVYLDAAADPSLLQRELFRLHDEARAGAPDPWRDWTSLNDPDLLYGERLAPVAPVTSGAPAMPVTSGASGAPLPRGFASPGALASPRADRAELWRAVVSRPAEVAELARKDAVLARELLALRAETRALSPDFFQLWRRHLTIGLLRRAAEGDHDVRRGTALSCARRWGWPELVEIALRDAWRTPDGRMLVHLLVRCEAVHERTGVTVECLLPGERRTWEQVTAQGASIGRLAQAVERVSRALDVYGRARLTALGLQRVVLCDDLSTGPRPAQGTAQGRTLYLDVDGARGELGTLHHELGHVLDRWLRPAPHSAVMACNDRSFDYVGYDLTLASAVDTGPSGFATEYGRADPREDFAELFAAMVCDPRTLAVRAETDPVLADKVLAARDLIGRAWASAGGSGPFLASWDVHLGRRDLLAGWAWSRHGVGPPPPSVAAGR